MFDRFRVADFLRFDPWALTTAIQFHAFGVMMARKKKEFLGGLVEFRPAVRLYREGRATGPPHDLRLKTITGEKNHAAISGC